MIAWNDLKTVVLKFSGEEQIAKGFPSRALTVKQLSADEYAVVEGDHRSHPVLNGSKLQMEIDGVKKGWVVTSIEDTVTMYPGAPAFTKVSFKPAQ